MKDTKDKPSRGFGIRSELGIFPSHQPAIHRYGPFLTLNQRRLFVCLRVSSWFGGLRGLAFMWLPVL